MSVSARSANRRTAIAALIVGAFAACISSPPPALEAQTPAPAPPCPASSILLTAQPIYGVGKTTIKNACPAFLTALVGWYSSHPAATVAQALAAIQGTPPVVTPPPVVVQPPAPIPTPQPAPTNALASVDFSKWSTAQLRDGSFWKGSGHDMGGIANPNYISFDSLERAMRYDFPNRSSAPCVGSEFTVAVMPRLNPAPSSKDLWIRFTSKESAGFAHGLLKDGRDTTGKTFCGGRSYKYFLINVESGAKMGRIGAYLGDGQPASQLSTRLYTDMNSPGYQSGVRGGFDIGGDQGWGGQYHEWTMGLEGIGTAAATFTVYLDRKLVSSITGPFLQGENVGAGWVVMLQAGANINSGPDHAQSRWWRQFGVYTQRPAGIP